MTGVGEDPRRRRTRWLARVDSLEAAGRHIDDLGLVLLFPADTVEAPSLWEALAGEDAAPFGDGMGENEARIWEWKDELPKAGLSWYGRFLHRRASLLSPDLLAALYPGPGHDTDHRSLELSREAHDIAEALRGGAMTTAALRAVIGDRSRYERAVGQLHRQLLITSAGVESRASGWPASVVELTCRLFAVGAVADQAYAADRYLDTMVITTTRDMARAFGWPVAATRERLNSLVSAGRAHVAEADTYVAAR